MLSKLGQIQQQKEKLNIPKRNLITIAFEMF